MPIFLPANEVKECHLAIINDWDRPCTRLIVYLHTVTPQYGVGYYLSDEISQQDATASIAEITPVNAFGMQVFLEEERGGIIVVADNDLPWTARYRNGDKRPWQPVLGEFEHRYRVKKQLLSLLG